MIKIAIGDPANIDNIMVKMGNHRFPNMGIFYIFAYLRSRIDDLELLYIRGDLGLEHYIERLREMNPDIYGISFASWVSDIAYKTINAVRREFGSIPIICGGTHPTALPEEVLAKTEADICVIGEGEETTLELIDYFRNGKKELSEIDGIMYKEKGSIKSTPTRIHIKDLSLLPMFPWDMIDISEYMGLGYCKAKPNTAMLFSRGCFYNCVYCSNPVWRTSSPWLRLRPPNDIKEEVKILYSKGVREIWIRADEFNSDLKWAEDVCMAINELDYSDLYFQCNLRADHITEEFVRGLKDINVYMINLGIESLNQRVLDGIKKQITVKQINEACMMLKKYGIDIYAWLMCYQIWEEDSKLCWEIPQEVENTLRLARQMHRKGLIDLMSWQMATPIPGAEMFNIAKKHNCISENYDGNVWNVNTVIPGVQAKQIHIHRIKGILLQSYMAYKKGRVNWSAKKNIWDKLKYIWNAIFHLIKLSFFK